MNEVLTIKTLSAAGWSDEAARDVTELMHAAVEQGKAGQAWAAISRDYLSPTHNFSLHQFLYEQCYGDDALLRSPGPAWWPTADVIDRANVTAAARELGLADYPALRRWSIDHRAAFWELAIRRLNVPFRTPPTSTLDDCDPRRPRWLVGATMNIVDSCLQGNDDAVAVIESDGGPLRTTTYAELRSLVARVANALPVYGIGPGDAVGMIAPMTAATVATYLGVIAAGAAVVSIADSFSAEEIATRLRISHAKLVVTQDFVSWGAKKLPLYDKVRAATELPIIVISPWTALPLPEGERAGVRGETPHDDRRTTADRSGQPSQLPPAASPDPLPAYREREPTLADRAASTDGRVASFPVSEAVALRAGDLPWQHFLSTNDHLAPIPRQPQDTVNILFSSGTTGEPKAIPWDHTTPIKCAADAYFHHDLHAGDVTCWPTNLGWMMGPWLIFASLMNRCAMALYAQAPQDRGFGQFVQDARVTMLGGVPSLVRAWRSTDCMKGLDWSRIRAFSSSGECSNAADQFYLMHLAGYRPIIEYCGGTEIGGGYLTSTVVQPNTPATFTTTALGIDVFIVDERSGDARPSVDRQDAAREVADSAASSKASVNAAHSTPASATSAHSHETSADSARSHETASTSTASFQASVDRARSLQTSADSADSRDPSATSVAASSHRGSSSSPTGAATDGVPFKTPAAGGNRGDETKPVVGEAFLVGPSIGLSTRLLNRDHDAVYFTDTPIGPDGRPLRRHGDELEALPNGNYRVAGRSDDTMNLGGIKVGCAELERALQAVPDVQETAAVAIAPPGGGPSRLIVFAVARAGASPSADALKAAMQRAIREQLNPLFRLEEVRLLPSLPRTASNKIMRRELRAMVQI